MHTMSIRSNLDCLQLTLDLLLINPSYSSQNLFFFFEALDHLIIGMQLGGAFCAFYRNAINLVLSFVKQ